MTPTSPDTQLHVFSTFLGLPPDTGTPPVCGAKLTAAYDWAGRGRPHCRACDRILAAHNAAKGRK